MKNYVQNGDTLALTAPVGGVVSGTAYLIGAIVVVAIHSAAAGATFQGRVEGVFNLPKATGAAWTEGAKLYWDNAAKNFTTTSAGNTFAGNAAAAAASGDTTGVVRLAGPMA